MCKGWVLLSKWLRKSERLLIYGDHANLSWLLGRSSKPVHVAARLERMISFVRQWPRATFVWTQGAQLCAADYLSRPHERGEADQFADPKVASILIPGGPDDAPTSVAPLVAGVHAGSPYFNPSKLAELMREHVTLPSATEFAKWQRSFIRGGEGSKLMHLVEFDEDPATVPATKLLTVKGRPWVPTSKEPDSFHWAILVSAHLTWAGHVGARQMAATLQKRLHWTGVREAAEALVASCLSCTTNQGPTPNWVPHGEHPTVTRFNQRITADWVDMQTESAPGPKSKHQFRYVHVLRCAFTGVTMALPSDSESAFNAAHNILQWCSQYGTDIEVLQTDQGPCYMAALFQLLVERLPAIHRTSLAYCAWSNVAETGVRLFRQALRPLIHEFGVPMSSWPYVLPVAVGAINNRPRASLGGKTPLEVAIGARPVTPIDVMLEPHPRGAKMSKRLPPESIARHADALHDALHKGYDSVVTLKEVVANPRVHKDKVQAMASMPHWAIGDFVLVLSDPAHRRDKNLGNWTGPWQIYAHPSPHVYCVKSIIDGDTLDNLHVARLKFFAPSDMKVTKTLKEHTANLGEGLEIDCIRNHRVVGRQLEFNIKWRGSVEDDHWENAQEIYHQALGAVRDYVNKLKRDKSARQLAVLKKHLPKLAGL